LIFIPRKFYLAVVKENKVYSQVETTARNLRLLGYNTKLIKRTRIYYELSDVFWNRIKEKYSKLEQNITHFVSTMKDIRRPYYIVITYGRKPSDLSEKKLKKIEEFLEYTKKFASLFWGKRDLYPL